MNTWYKKGIPRTLAQKKKTNILSDIHQEEIYGNIYRLINQGKI